MKKLCREQKCLARKYENKANIVRFKKGEGRVDGELNGNVGINWDAEYQKMLGTMTQYFLQGNVLCGDEIEESQKAIMEMNRFKVPLGCQKQIDCLMKLAVKLKISFM